MSAMMGAGASRARRANAGASSAVGRLTRTSSQPAATSARTCASVAAASPVLVHVMDCTATGAPPPTGTEPTMIRRALGTRPPAGRRRLPGPLAVPRPRLLEATGEGLPRLPAEHPLRAPGVGPRVADVAGARGCEAPFDGAARQFFEAAQDVQDARGGTGTHIEYRDATEGPLEGSHDGLDHVAHVHEVARLLSVTVYRYRLARGCGGHEAADHAGILGAGTVSYTHLRA